MWEPELCPAFELGFEVAFSAAGVVSPACFSGDAGVDVALGVTAVGWVVAVGVVVVVAEAAPAGAFTLGA